MGARPMALAVIQDNLKKPLANELLFGSLVGRSGDRGTGSGEEQTTYERARRSTSRSGSLK